MGRDELGRSQATASLAGEQDHQEVRWDLWKLPLYDLPMRSELRCPG